MKQNPARTETPRSLRVLLFPCLPRDKNKDPSFQLLNCRMFEKQFWPYGFMTGHSSAKGTRPGPACRPVSLIPTPAFTSQGQVPLNLGGLEYPIQPSAAVGVGMLPPHPPPLSHPTMLTVIFPRLEFLCSHPSSSRDTMEALPSLG